jgi:D-lactate dehydrogenase (cytochrome)
MSCIAARSTAPVVAAPTLFFECHGGPQSCAGDVAMLSSIADEFGGEGFAAASDEPGRRRLWKSRHDAFWSVKSAWPGRHVLVTDIAVPLSQLAAAVEQTAADIDELQLVAPIVGHVGDGNFHAIVVFDRDDAASARNVDLFVDRLAARAIAMDGTVTGEHGIGEGKRRLLKAEHGAAADLMYRIKFALDPQDIMNPRKVFAY